MHPLYIILYLFFWVIFYFAGYTFQFVQPKRKKMYESKDLSTLATRL